MKMLVCSGGFHCVKCNQEKQVPIPVLVKKRTVQSSLGVVELAADFAVWIEQLVAAAVWLHVWMILPLQRTWAQPCCLQSGDRCRIHAEDAHDDDGSVPGFPTVRPEN